MTQFTRVSRARCRGFTLIELMTVIVIILVLAGIVLGLTRYANDKAARAKTEAEISAISAALENYKSDNGVYPRDIAVGAQTSATDTLDARQGDSDFTKNYPGASAVMYRAVSGDPGSDGSGTPVQFNKTYYNIPQSELTSGGKAAFPANTVTSSSYMLDPFGNPFGYSTAYDADVQAGKSPPARGFNPTYDLWSTAGFGGAKSYPGSMKNTDYQSLWIKNW